MACHSIGVDKDGEPTGGTPMGEMRIHWKPSLNQVGRRSFDQDRSSDDVFVYKWFNRFVSVLESRASARVYKLLERDLVRMSAFLRVEQHFLSAAILDPARHIVEIKTKIRARDQRLKMSGIRKWRHSLKTKGGLPSPTMYRWLRGKPPQRAWSEITHPNLPLRTALEEYIDSLPPDDTPLLVAEEEVSACLESARLMNTRSCSGLDCWPVSAVRLLDKASARVLVLCFHCFEKLARWPQELLQVRCQLIPKPVPILHAE
eukprot:4347227-Amphidinium_carterae.1